MSTSNSERCTICILPGTKACTGCNSARYCSVECRDTDWQTHKLLCRSFKDFLTPSSSQDENTKFKRAILFPSDSEVPRFVWLKSWKESDEGMIWEDNNAGRMIGRDGCPQRITGSTLRPRMSMR